MTTGIESSASGALVDGVPDNDPFVDMDDGLFVDTGDDPGAVADTPPVADAPEADAHEAERPDAATPTEARIISPRAGMFDLESRDTSTERLAGDPVGGAGNDGDALEADDVELEWNYPVIIATAAAVLVVLVILGLVLF